MNPKRIKLHNYRTIIDLDLDLPEGTVAVSGRNGAGKSSIIGSIEVALFGPPPPARSLAAYHAERATDDVVSVELDYEHKGDLLRVRRAYSVAGRGKPSLDYWMLDPTGNWHPITSGSITETQAEIEAWLGLERSTFRASTYLAQGDGGAFTEAEPKKRKQILADVLSLAIWERSRALVRADRSEVEGQGRVLSGRVETLTERAGDIEEVETAIVEKTAAVESFADSIRRASTDLDVEQRRVADLETAQTRFDAFATAADAARRAANDHDTLKRVAEGECEPAIAQAQTELDAMPADDIAELDRRALELGEQRRALTEKKAEAERLDREHAAAIEQRDRLRARSSEARAEFNRVEALYNDAGAEGAKCDRCEQTLGAEAREVARESLQVEAARHAAEAIALDRGADDLVIPHVGVHPDPAELAEVDAAIADVVARATIVKGSLARRGTLEQIITAARERLAGVMSAEYDVENRRLHEQALAAEGRLTQDMAVDPDALGNARESVAMLTRKIDLDRSAENIARLELGALQERLSAKRQAAAELETAKREAVDVLGRLVELQELERAFAPDGVAARIVEQQAIPQIEADATRILEALGGPVSRVELRTERIKGDGGTSDVLDIVCVTELGDRDYATFSGGERTRVNLALRIALARLLASRAGAGSRVLTIDEPEFLDEDGTSALVDVLRTETQTGAFDRVLLVSHVPSLRDAFDTVIQVENVDGVTEVTVG